MDVNAWLQYLETLHPRAMELGLERIRTVAERLNCLSFTCPVITVAGTNGKGSTVAFLSEIWRSAGYRVGTYTSPHLFQFQERIQYDGQNISTVALLDAFETVEAARGAVALTYFEFTTLAAFVFFQKQKPDVLVLEVGLGGRLDAVNIVDPTLAVITPIGLDHCEWLGSDRAQIAVEKAGIMRANIPVIIGDREPPHTLLERAIELKTSVYALGKDFDYTINSTVVPRLVRGIQKYCGITETLGPADKPRDDVLVERDDEAVLQGERWCWRGKEGEYIHLPLPKLSMENAAVAIQAVECLQQLRPVSKAAIAEGVAEAFLPARQQWIAGTPEHVCDVAHNPHGVASLAEALARKKTRGKTHAIWSMLADKDLPGSVQPLLPEVDHWYVAPLVTARAATLTQLTEALKTVGAHSVISFDHVKSAYFAARDRAAPEDRILIYGSFYTVAEVMPLLSPSGLSGYNRANSFLQKEKHDG